MSADLSSGPNLMYPAPENGHAHLTSSSSVPNQRRQSINPNLPTMGKGNKSQYGMSIIARNLPEGGNLTLRCQVIALHKGRKKRYFMITLEKGVKGQRIDELAKVYLEGNPHFQTAENGNSNNEYVGHEKEFNRELLTAVSKRILECACEQEWNLWLDEGKTLVHKKVLLDHSDHDDMQTDGFQIFTRDKVPQPPLDENGNVTELDENGNVKEPELDENGNIKVGVSNNGVPCGVRREEEARAREAATPPETKKRHRYFKHNNGATETKKSRKSVQRVPSPPPKTSKKLEKATKRNSPKNLLRNRQRG